MTLRQLTESGVYKLTENGIEDAELDAFLLLQFLTGISRTQFYVHRDEEGFVNTEKIKEDYFNLIEKRCIHIPLAYITGSADFMGLTFSVNDSVLIPEQDTEVLVEEVLKYSEGKSILDLCTGSGCIAVSLAILGNPAKVLGSDISEKALEVARENAKKLSADVTLIQGDLFDGITEKFDIIVSNPPYIKTDVIQSLAPEVRDHEPVLALDGDKDGLSFYRRISAGAAEHLNKNGRIYYEIGYDEAAEVSAILADCGFRNIEVIKDLAGLDRVVFAERE